MKNSFSARALAFASVGYSASLLGGNIVCVPSLFAAIIGAVYTAQLPFFCFLSMPRGS